MLLQKSKTPALRSNGSTGKKGKGRLVDGYPPASPKTAGEGTLAALARLPGSGKLPKPLLMLSS